MIRRPPRSTLSSSSAASDVYKRQGINAEYGGIEASAMSDEELPTQDVGELIESAPQEAEEPQADEPETEAEAVAEPTEEPSEQAVEDSEVLNGEEEDSTSVIFPLARIRKIIKADPEVKTVNKESLQLIGKATEMLLGELAKAALHVAEKQKRKTVNYNDVATVVRTHEVFQFLEDTVRPSTGEAKAPAAKSGDKRVRAPEAEAQADPKQSKLSFGEPKSQGRGLTKLADAKPAQEEAPDDDGAVDAGTEQEAPAEAVQEAAPMEVSAE
eukprot:TRINITY_DN19850_c0_g1_i1.p1 TRINITY_DN19850_c0_g1~~TRINITY_DN19850_c0_g1_i1.p1  ORF type:complete len:270 (+),score=85.66 TRINITY_DN19850_c0_g1_i1:77-886(+)